MNKRILVSLIIVYLFSSFGILAQAEKSGTDSPGNKTGEKDSRIWTVFFKNAYGKEVPLYCQVAITKDEKARGLMFREYLPKDEGMIFVYSKPQRLSFWMQHTKIPLSIAFIAKKKYVISIKAMKPLDTTVIHSEIPALYAVETNAGWFKKNRISIHDKVRIIKYKVIRDERVNEEKRKRESMKNKYKNGRY